MVEIMVALVIIAILATLSIPIFRNVLEEQKARVCKTNLLAIKTALDIYVMEQDVLPATLGELPTEYIDRAYAQLMREKGAWRTKLAYWILDWTKRGSAYAFTLYEMVKGNKKVMICPGDTNTTRGYSYGFNKGLEGMTATAYRNLGGNVVLIADANQGNFSTLAANNATTGLALDRHKRFGIAGTETYNQAVTANNTVLPVALTGNCYVPGRPDVYCTNTTNQHHN
jgi:type II secretory pathway pseudopilin PulG